MEAMSLLPTAHRAGYCAASTTSTGSPPFFYVTHGKSILRTRVTGSCQDAICHYLNLERMERRLRSLSIRMGP